MRGKADLVRGWVRKARSDLLAAKALMEAGAFDACCFHAQQAAEKLLKAYLTHRDVRFPFTHNLMKLLRLAVRKDRAFADLETVGRLLTPYAVELRYDQEFWPDPEVARRAHQAAEAVAEFALARLPPAVAD